MPAESAEVATRDESVSDEEVHRPENTPSPEGSLANAYARDQLLMMYFLPEAVKKRIRAVKKLQVDVLKLQAEFYQDMHKVEMKYQNKYESIYEKRAKIVAGDYEPTEQELHPEDNVPNIPPEVAAKVKLEHPDMPDGPGIPYFWQTIFKNVGMLNELTFPQDLDILKHLIDIKIHLKNDPMGFILEFQFTPNDYFTNTILTKEYIMKCSPDDADPFSFEGPEIHKAIGCNIDWKPNKNVTIRTIKKKQKHKVKGSVRTVFKTEKNNSFFNFFSPPNIPDDPAEEMDEDAQMSLSSDFEVGHYLRERVIPHALLFYTGEALEDEESYEDDEDDESASASSEDKFSRTETEESEN